MISEKDHINIKKLTQDLIDFYMIKHKEYFDTSIKVENMALASTAVTHFYFEAILRLLPSDIINLNQIEMLKETMINCICSKIDILKQSFMENKNEQDRTH